MSHHAMGESVLCCARDRQISIRSILIMLGFERERPASFEAGRSATRQIGFLSGLAKTTQNTGYSHSKKEFIVKRWTETSASQLPD